MLGVCNVKAFEYVELTNSYHLGQSALVSGSCWILNLFFFYLLSLVLPLDDPASYYDLCTLMFQDDLIGKSERRCPCSLIGLRCIFLCSDSLCT